jgi:hypothetical protein
MEPQGGLRPRSLISLQVPHKERQRDLAVFTSRSYLGLFSGTFWFHSFESVNILQTLLSNPRQKAIVSNVLFLLSSDPLKPLKKHYFLYYFLVYYIYVIRTISRDQNQMIIKTGAFQL